MKNKILVIGSTGKLGIKLLNFCKKKSIKIDTATCFNNIKKLNLQIKKFDIKNGFQLNCPKKIINFKRHLENSNFKLIYFLDHGSKSLLYLDIILKFQKKCHICIANKEMIIAGGALLIKSINKSKNYFIPMDSEHFSLINNKISNDTVKKIYITASGGPIYFNKNINLNTVSKNKVLSHPKWEMGANNLIDSSNFINKILELYELSAIYNIDIDKLDFIISPEAFVHSIIQYKDNTFSYNCFHNDMLITLIKPLTLIYNTNYNFRSINIFDQKNFFFEIPNDKRFLILSNLSKLKKLSHAQTIKFMILNNIAQNLYLSNKLKYIEIPKFILKHLFSSDQNTIFNNFKKIINYILYLEKQYKKYYV